MSKRKSLISWSPLRAKMKEAGAEIVSKEAIKILMNYLEAKAKVITEKSLELAKHSKRKKITQADVQLTIDNLSSDYIKARLD